MNINWDEYTSIEQLEKDIKSIKIQGATNVALAVIRGVEIVTEDKSSDFNTILESVVRVGNRLASTRTNEPLARNAVKYIETNFKIRSVGYTSDEEKGKLVSQLASEYLNLIEKAKGDSLGFTSVLPPTNNAFTHCHSSTVEKLLKKMSETYKPFQVACSETRPVFQGRITAQNLNSLGVKTTLVVDSAGPSFVADRAFFPIDTVFIGADEITLNGDVVNKVGSFGIALASYYSSTPVYVVSTLLKVNPATAYKDVQIELRSPFEVWENPPKGVEIYNPAFDLVPSKLITGFVTEVGVIKPEEIASKVHETYDWVF